MHDGKGALAAFIRWVMRHTVYYRVTLATVTVQAGQTVDLICDDPDLSGLGLQGVPLMYGLPGSTAQIVPGCKVLLLFSGGDPRKPVAVGFDGSAIVTQLGGGTMPVARVGDSIVVTVTSLGSPAVGTVIGGSSQVLSA